MTGPEGESADGALLRLIGGYRVTQAIYVVTKLGVPDALSQGPKDAATLAAESGVRPDRLYRVLRALASIGLFTMDDRARFDLTDTGRLLRTQPGGSFANAAIFAGEEPYRAWGDLLHSVRTGETAFDHTYGVGHFEYLAHHPEASTTFNRLMAWSVGVAGYPLEGYDLGRHELLVDVGGGTGSLIGMALRTYPRLRGILFDRATAVKEAPAVLREYGVADRCEIRTGSAFDGVPAGGDVYVMSRVLHDWPDDQASRLLTNCRRAMAEGSVLLLVDGVLPEGLAAPSRLWIDLVMMVLTGGHERTESEWRALLRGAGFSLSQIRPTPTNQDLIEARPVGPASPTPSHPQYRAAHRPREKRVATGRPERASPSGAPAP
jgi:SAM-dependent methyltransferase